MDDITENWMKFKAKLDRNIRKVKNNGSVEETTLDVMLNLLENIKLESKSIEEQYNEVTDEGT